MPAIYRKKRVSRRAALAGFFGSLAAALPLAARRATCTGADPCNACKNCKYCKRCAKDGKTCGTCKRAMALSHGER